MHIIRDLPVEQDKYSQYEGKLGQAGHHTEGIEGIIPFIRGKNGGREEHPPGQQGECQQWYQEPDADKPGSSDLPVIGYGVYISGDYMDLISPDGKGDKCTRDHQADAPYKILVAQQVQVPGRGQSHGINHKHYDENGLGSSDTGIEQHSCRQLQHGNDGGEARKGEPEEK